MKPSDFFITILDFFAVLLPGAAAAYFIAEEASARHWVSTLANTWQPVGFAMAAYVLGHLIFLLGSYLDPLYDLRSRRRRSFEDGGAFRAAAAIRDARSPALRGAGLSTFKWCRAFVALNAPAARSELEYHEATSKFFRSLVVLLVLACPALVVSDIPGLPGARVALSVTAAGLAWLCFLRFCDQRWKLTELAYTYTVLLAAPGDQAAPRQVSPPPREPRE